MSHDASGRERLPGIVFKTLIRSACLLAKLGRRNAAAPRENRVSGSLPATKTSPLRATARSGAGADARMQTCSVHLDQSSSGLELAHDLGPKPFERGEQSGRAAVADAQPDHAHALGAQDRQLREIFVFCHDHRARSRGVLPDQLVGGLPHAEVQNVIGLAASGLKPTRERAGQLVIDKEARHEAARSKTWSFCAAANSRHARRSSASRNG